MWLAVRAFPFLLRPLELRAALADDTDLKELTRKHALALLAGEEATIPLGPTPRAVVMGHTHELDATRDYVNLGTWIDHVRGLSPHDLVSVDRSLPVLVVYDDESAVLRDCRELGESLDGCPVRWRRKGAAA